MQLQSEMEALTKAGVQVVGISYDGTATLARFTDKAKLTFPLLSEPNAATINAYHIRNEEADKDKRSRGVPHPGTFLIDQSGVIRAKLGYEGYRKRYKSSVSLGAVAALQE